MRTILFPTILFILLSIGVAAQSPVWQWAHSAGGAASDGAQGVSTDTAGNIYAVGSFQSPSK